MVQTSAGAGRSEWLNFIKACARQYPQWKASGMSSKIPSITRGKSNGGTVLREPSKETPVDCVSSKATKRRTGQSSVLRAVRNETIGTAVAPVAQRA